MSKATDEYYQYKEESPIPIRWTAPEVIKSHRFTKPGIESQ